ncbi:MAG TPA: hypothetical protein VGV35_16525, partial [Bryobacteraceae bacterium]|nr:hypothetical protein [Bryobacteraceae bacterium]
LVGWAELVASVESAVLVGLAAEIACPPCRVGAADGNTIPSIAAGRLIKTGQPQIALAARRVAILSPSDRPAPGNKLAGKAATWPVPAEGLESAVGAEPV